MRECRGFCHQDTNLPKQLPCLLHFPRHLSRTSSHPLKVYGGRKTWFHDDNEPRSEFLWHLTHESTQSMRTRQHLSFSWLYQRTGHVFMYLNWPKSWCTKRYEHLTWHCSHNHSLRMHCTSNWNNSGLWDTFRMWHPQACESWRGFRLIFIVDGRARLKSGGSVRRVMDGPW